MATGNTGGGSGSGTSSGAQRGRKVYKLGVHKLKRKKEDGQAEYVDVPILSRALRRVGTLLKLDEASEQDVATVVEFEGGNATYYRRGAVAADRILIVYEETSQDGKTKVRQIQLPIPAWAPNYKLVGTLAAKAKGAGLKLRGIRRHGYLIDPPSSSDGGGGSGGGGGGTGSGGGG